VLDAAGAALGGHLDRHDLVVEDPVGDRLLGLLLAARSECVLFLAADLVPVGEILRGAAHVDVVKGIPETVVDHRVDQLSIAHPRAEPSRRHQVRGTRHVLHAAGHDDLDVACADHLRGDRDRLEAGSAEHVDCRRRDLLRDARGDRHLAGHVLSEPCLQDAAEHDLVDLMA
jgi:hypothetical protein